MKKITDVGMFLLKNSKSFDKVPISHGGRSDMYNTPRVLHNPKKYTDQSDGSTPDLYALMVKYHLKGFEFGNWVTQEERNEYATSIKTTLEQLKDILKTDNIGFNVQIGIAFGARYLVILAQKDSELGLGSGHTHAGVGHLQLVQNL